MIKLTTIFYQAEDPTMLDDYYYNHYLPMVLRMPDVIKVESTRLYTDMKKVLLKEPDVTPVYQIISDLYFESFTHFEKSLSSKPGEYIANSAIKVAWDLMICVIGDVSTMTPEEYKRDPSLIKRFYNG